MSSRRGVIVGGAVIVAALLYLLVGGIGDSLVYFITPSELLAMGETARGQSFRLSGTVEPGSIEWDAETLELRFQLTDEETAITVESEGVPPQMFHDGIDVVLEGVLAEAGVFRATNVMVKHSNEYGPPPEGAEPATRFHGLLEGTTK